MSRHMLYPAIVLMAGLLAAPYAVAQSSGTDSNSTKIATQGAVLQGLDKVTARISTFEVPFETRVVFGSLSIQVRACHKAPPTEVPESTAFLEIRENLESTSTQDLFVGWMFSSSPAVSALEHPVYDVWVVDCMKASSSAPESSG